MTIQSNFTNEDWSAYVEFIRSQVTQGAGNNSKIWLLAVGFGVLLGLIISIGKIQIHLLSVIIGSFGMALWIVFFSRSKLKNMRQGMLPSTDGVILGPYSFSIGDDGIRTSAANYEAFYRWKTVRGTQITDKHIFIMVDNMVAITIPRRSFSSDYEREQFLGEIMKHASS